MRMPARRRVEWTGRSPVEVSSMFRESMPTRAAPTCSSHAAAASDCERILRELPGWFGIPSAIDEYRRSLDRLDTYVALMDGRVAGFLALKPLTPASAEIH